MKRTRWRFLAGVSVAAALAAPLAAQVRPHYGGTLRVEMQAALRTLDPATPLTAPNDIAARDKLGRLVFEPLVRLDDAGRPQPHLAISWQPDAEAKQWQFRLRRGVTFHDGAPMTPSAVAMSLAASLPGRRASVFGETLIVQADVPQPDLLEELAGPRGWVVRRTSSGLSGTGAFRIEQWEPGARGAFVANEEYWAGRAYLDGVEVRLGRALRDQMIALELGRADVVEVALDQLRRLTQTGIRTWASPPLEWMAMIAAPGDSADAVALRSALAVVSLAIDRAAIHNVLLQKQGEPAGGLLPQWLSGYAFLFATAADVERARQMWASRGGEVRLPALAYDANDALARGVTERIALNARDAGINLPTAALTPQAAASAPLRLARVRLRGTIPRAALARIGEALSIAELTQLPFQATAEELYEAEHGLVASGRVVALFHLPEIFALGPRVRNWEWSKVAAVTGDWRWEELWLAPAAGEEKR